jgi:hypothetical protein
METFVIMPLTSTYPTGVTTGLLCENIALLYIHPSSKIRARRISPLFAYSEELGYLKTFNEMIKRPHLLEEDVKNAFEFGIEVCEKTGCHVTLYPDARSVYAYTLPYKTRAVIVGKCGDYYQLQTGGYTTKFFQQYMPVRQNKRLFRFFPIKDPFYVIITHPEGTFCNSDLSSSSSSTQQQQKWIPSGKMVRVHRKGFVQDKMVFFSNDGWIAHEDVQPLGKGFVAPCTTASSLSPLCLICTQKPVNCSFIHGDIAHSFCCHDCSQKIAATSTTCPICRLRVDKIVLNFTQEYPSACDDDTKPMIKKKTESPHTPLEVQG